MRPIRSITLLMLPIFGLACSKPGISLQPASFMVNDYRLEADLYRPSAPEDWGVILLHGSNPSGRKLALYAELARHLAERGATAINLDMRGYGESEKPRQLKQVNDLDFIDDIVELLSWLVTHPDWAFIQRWYIVGHSFGGGVALHAGNQSDYIEGIISISPGRRINERFFSAPDNEGFRYLVRRKSADMGLKEYIPDNLIGPMIQRYNMEGLRGHFFTKPMLLVEGSREPGEDLAYSRDWFATLGGAVEHQVIAGADHYFGTAVIQLDGKKQWAVADPETVHKLFTCIYAWISRQPGATH